MKRSLIILIALFLAPITSCAEGDRLESKNEIIGLKNKILEEISCPNVNPMFGGFEFCSYGTITEQGDILTLYLRQPTTIRGGFLLNNLNQMEKYHFLRDVVCDAVGVALGVSDDAVLGIRKGILQRISIDKLEKQNLDTEINKIALNLRLSIRVSSGNDTYILKRWAFTEANKYPLRCDVYKENDFTKN